MLHAEEIQEMKWGTTNDNFNINPKSMIIYYGLLKYYNISYCAIEKIIYIAFHDIKKLGDDVYGAATRTKPLTIYHGLLKQYISHYINTKKVHILLHYIKI